LIRKNINTARMNVQPKLPHDFSKLHLTLQNVINKMWTKNNENWIFINDVQNNIICLTNQINLNFLKQCDSIFMDGTFSSCHFPYKQFFVIHGYKNKSSKYVPLFIFSLSPSKLPCNTYKTTSKVVCLTISQIESSVISNLHNKNSVDSQSKICL
jgi:hypothetical protein